MLKNILMNPFIQQFSCSCFLSLFAEDLFYVTAVIIKQSVDRVEANTSTLESNNANLEAIMTLVTLTSDVGLSTAAEIHIQHALHLLPHNNTDATLLFRSILLTPAVYRSIDAVFSTRKLLEDRLDNLYSNISNYVLPKLNEFSLPPTFYLVYMGFSDRDFMYKLQHSYAAAHPSYADYSLLPVSTVPKPLLQIGFVSSFFRRHSICKLFCGIITGLDIEKYPFHIYIFSALQANREDDVTKDLRKAALLKKDRMTFVGLGHALVGNRHEIIERNIDILVSKRKHIFPLSLSGYSSTRSFYWS